MTPDAPRNTTDRLTVGRLLAHGQAPHEFRPRAEESYFVRLQTERGERTLWSPSLKRAFSDSRTQPQVGDQIGVKENGIDPVSVVTRKKDAEGRVTEQRRYDAPRTHWVVEKREFFDERSSAARALRDSRVHPREALRDHPDLLGAYLTLDSAGKIAEQRIEHPQSRERFLALIRETLAHATERGEPLPVVRLRERDPSREPSRSLERAPAPVR